MTYAATDGVMTISYVTSDRALVRGVGFAHSHTFSKTLVIAVLSALFIISPLLVFIVITATTISVAVATYVLILPVTY